MWQNCRPNLTAITSGLSQLCRPFCDAVARAAASLISSVTQQGGGGADDTVRLSAAIQALQGTPPRQSTTLNPPATSQSNLKSRQFLPPNAQINYVHGTTSASLEAIITNGLIPYGLLSSPPFSGALDVGITEMGVNKSFISTYPVEHAHRTSQYACELGWNPRYGQKEICFLEKEVEKLVEKKERRLKTDPTQYLDWVDKSYERDIALARQLIGIHQSRISIWKRLNESQQARIRHPFPVIIGIQYNGQTYSVVSDGYEKALPPITPDRLLLFVPTDKVELAKSLVAANDSEIPVQSAEVIISSTWAKITTPLGEDLFNSDLPEDRIASIPWALERLSVSGVTFFLEELLKDEDPTVVNAASECVPPQLGLAQKTSATNAPS